MDNEVPEDHIYVLLNYLIYFLYYTDIEIHHLGGFYRRAALCSADFLEFQRKQNIAPITNWKFKIISSRIFKLPDCMLILEHLGQLDNIQHSSMIL